MPETVAKVRHREKVQQGLAQWIGARRQIVVRSVTAAANAVGRIGEAARLLRAAAAAPTRPRFVYLSALGTSDRTRNEYLRARARVEAEVRASGLPYVIVRPSFITGADREESRPAERLMASGTAALSGLLSLVGARRLGARLRPRTGAELAEAMVRLALAGGDSRVVESEEL